MPVMEHRMSDLEVQSREYRGLANRIYRQHRRTVRDHLKARVGNGLNATELARELGIDRERLYAYARACGLRFATQTVIIDDLEAAREQATEAALRAADAAIEGLPDGLRAAGGGR